MDLKITGTPKEIADLVLGIQSQQVDELIEKLNLYGVVQKAIHDKNQEYQKEYQKMMTKSNVKPRGWWKSQSEKQGD